MKNTIEEEEKKYGVAVHGFGNLESNKNLGKRSAQTSPGDLEQEITGQ
jgi:hypothetical protein